MNESTIYGITILDDYSPTYGLLDASFWALGIGYDVGNSASPSAGYGFNTSNLTLSWYGCLNDNGVHDCAEMCTDPNNIWASANNSMYTLANCAVYPFISVLLSNNGLDVTSQAVAKDFNILPMNATGDVITPIAGCINSTAGSSCTGIAIYDPNAIYLPGWSLSVQAMVSWQYNTTNCVPDAWEVCNIQDNGDYIDPDLGGTGVYISYYMQQAIVLVAWLFLRCILRIGTIPWLRKKNWARRLKKSEQREAMLQALVDFQKTQSFFMIAVQIAGLIALARASLFGASSTRELWADIYFIKGLAVGGCLPIAFVLLVLHLEGLHSVYIFGISSITIVLSSITFAINITPSRDSTAYTAVPGCGDTGNPTTTCPAQYFTAEGLSGFGSNMGPFVNKSMVFMSLATLGFLFFDMLAVFPGERGTKSRRNFYQWAEPNLPSALTLCIRLMVLLLECYFVVQTVFFVLELTYNSFDATIWGVGQIISVTIWTPVICEWFYAAFFGLEEASKYRIPKPYKVVKDDCDETLFEPVENDKSHIQLGLLDPRGFFAHSNASYTSVASNPSRTHSPSRGSSHGHGHDHGHDDQVGKPLSIFHQPSQVQATVYSAHGNGPHQALAGASSGSTSRVDLVTAIGQQGINGVQQKTT